MEQGKFDPPPFMEPGSIGKAVNPLLQFLDRWATAEGKGMTGIKQDDEYGVTGVWWMKEYQKAKGLKVNGRYCPETRAAMLRDGFDFVAAAKASGEHITAFEQPDSRTLYWGPGIAACESRDEAGSRIHRQAHVGN